MIYKNGHAVFTNVNLIISVRCANNRLNAL